jgi:hypothetical protein
MQQHAQISDEQRKKNIEALGAAMVLSSDMTERASLWRRLKEEIASRSAAQVARMEREKGLR